MAAAEALPTVSVVIPTSGRREILSEAIAAVLADPGASEVLIVLDESSGATAEGDRLMERLAAIDPRVRTMRTPTGDQDLLSLQVARDAGTELAASEVVLSLDDDVILEPGAVSGHARLHAQAEGQVVVGYMPVVSSERWPRSSATIRFYSEAYEYTCDRYEADPGVILRQMWCGNVSVRRSDWLRAIRRPRLKCQGHDDQELRAAVPARGAAREDRPQPARRPLVPALAPRLRRAGGKDRSGPGEAAHGQSRPARGAAARAGQARADLGAGPVALPPATRLAGGPLHPDRAGCPGGGAEAAGHRGSGGALSVVPRHRTLQAPGPARL